MIISRTPYRISFLGGGSDLPAFYKKYQGSVISTSINQYVYISVHPSFNPDQILLKYDKIEIVTDINDITHPITRAVLRKLGVRGVEITSTGDIPGQTGLGSSSSFTVGLLHALHTYLGNTKTHEELAREACEVEIELLGGPIGKQDQYAAAFGGLNRFDFNTDETVTTAPIALSADKKRQLESSLMLFFTGTKRSASPILSEQSKNISNSKDRAGLLQKMVNEVPALQSELEEGNVAAIGEYLHKGWMLKRELASAISNSDIDLLYSKALSLGAVGGKILGAGGGGFLLFYCPEEKQAIVSKQLGIRQVPLAFEELGSQIIYES
jgi:D-glycero-alpha-D-manno-heptose-7-phosphate kinase